MTVAGALNLLAAALLTAAFAWSAVRLAGIPDVAGQIVAGLVAAAAQVVLLAELLSMVGVFTATAVTLATLVTTSLSLWLSHRCKTIGRPRTPTIRRPPQPRWLIRESTRVVRAAPASAGAIALLLAITVTELILAIAVAPNTFDSLGYHLTRAAYWIQEHSVTQFNNASERQAAFPINGEVLLAWVMMLSRGDRLVQLVQWISQFGALAFVFAQARDLGFERRESLFACVALAATPVMIGQSTSTQNDLVVAFFVAASVLFTQRALRANSMPYYALAGVAFGLAIGTKTTALLAIPMLTVAALAVTRHERRPLARLSVAVVVGVALLGAFNYVQNYHEHGSLTAARNTQEGLRVDSPSELPGNLVRLAWTGLVDSPGIVSSAVDESIRRVTKPILGSTEKPGSRGFDSFSLSVNHDLREDHIGFGAIGLFALLPCLLVALLHFRRRERFVIALMPLVLFVSIAATLRHNIWIARFLLPAVIVAVPLIAMLARREGGRVLLLVLALSSAFPMLIQNGNKPLVPAGGGRSILTMERVEQMTLLAPREAASVDSVDAAVPKDGRLGFVGDADAWEYPYFGPNLDRRLVKLTEFDLEPGVLDLFRLDALIVSAPDILVPPSLGGVKLDDEHTLIVRKPL